MGAAVWGAGQLLPQGPVTFASMATALAAKIAVGAAVYALMARILRMPELGWTIGRRAAPR